MATVRESARDVPVIADVDVLVVGSGPGGLGAARAGAKTMLLERFGCLGGNITVVTLLLSALQLILRDAPPRDLSRAR